MKSKQLWVPDLTDLVSVLQRELEQHFNHAKVSVVDCPDLTKWGCAACGLGGDPVLVEGGGEPFNHDQDYNKEVHFKLDRMAEQVGHGPGSYIQGAGAACAAQLRGHLGELVPCVTLGKENLTKAARVDSESRAAIVEEDVTLMCGGISNLYMCKGEPGKVVEVEASGRKGDQASLTQILKSGLGQLPGLHGKQVGLGGVFRMETGSVKAHVNPDMEVLPKDYYDPGQMKCVKDFLQFYDFPAPLLCFTCLWTDEVDDGSVSLNLRSSGEHTHFWREREDGKFDSEAGGHYHGDTSPEKVSYRGYFAPANSIYRLWDAIQQRQEDNARMCK